MVQAEMNLDRLGNLSANGQYRIERSHRVLENDADLRPTNFLELRLTHFEQILPVEQGRSRDNLAGWGWHQAQDRKHCDAFSTTAFADQPKGLAVRDAERHAIDRVDRPLRSDELGFQPMYFQQYIFHNSPLPKDHSKQDTGE